jgi:hypothetical protein
MSSKVTEHREWNQSPFFIDIIPPPLTITPID